MSAFPAPAPSAVPFELAATLDAYQQDVGLLVGAPLDVEAYHRVSHHMDRMRQQASALPSVSAAWVEVMICHFELTHELWRAHHDAAGTPELQQLHGRLRQAAHGLSLECERLMPTA